MSGPYALPPNLPGNTSCTGHADAPDLPESRRHLLASVTAGERGNGWPVQMVYDPARPHLKAREAEVAALVAAAKAEAARRHAKRKAVAGPGAAPR